MKRRERKREREGKKSEDCVTRVVLMILTHTHVHCTQSKYIMKEISSTREFEQLRDGDKLFVVDFYAVVLSFSLSLSLSLHSHIHTYVYSGLVWAM